MSLLACVIENKKEGGEIINELSFQRHQKPALTNCFLCFHFKNRKESPVQEEVVC